MAQEKVELTDYRLVDAYALECDLIAVADAIREKAGTSAPLHFPYDMVDAVAGIDTGEEVDENYIPLGFFERTLASITFPAGVTKIPQYAFMDCENLVFSEIPEGVIKLETQCFRNCKMGETMTLPSTLQTGANYAFMGCSALRTVVFKGKAQSLGVGFFQNENVTDIYVPWAEGEVANAPWGAANATIHYNHVEEG